MSRRGALRFPAERRLMLRSAGVAECRVAAPELIAAVDWRLLAQILRERKLLTVLGPRIVAMAPAATAGEFAAAVDAALAQGRRQALLLQAVHGQVVGALAAAGVRASPLKGPALGEYLYSDLGRRLSSDIDLIVDRRDLDPAAAVVRGLGYGAPEDPVGPDGLPELHLAFVHPTDTWPPVEVHWRIHPYDERFGAERLLAPELDPRGLWEPADADQLAALLLYFTRDGFIDLRHLADLTAWWDTRGGEAAAPALEGIAVEFPRLRRALAAACAATAALGGWPLDLAGPLDRRQRLAVRLANPHPTASTAQLFADRGLIDGLLAPRRGFPGYVRRRLLPPAPVRRRHADRADRARLRSALTRCAGILGRNAWTLGRCVAGRSWGHHPFTASQPTRKPLRQT